ncbi:hypothetical protein K8R42_04155 [bacterium]|nr:hypothetical protein [bacterium]
MMNREEFATKFHWSKVVWFAGITNVVALSPQLISLIKTHETAGLSTTMFGLFLLMQIIFAVQGYLTKSKGQMVTMLLSAVETATIITLITHFRHVS